MIIEYDGTNFFGWQYQPDKRTVQSEIESAIKQITGEDVRVTGAGRTDHGVHALGQVANFKTESNIQCEKLRAAINSLIGEDVYIKQITEVPLNFHARYSARSKIYRYNIMLTYSPLKRRYYWFVDYKLNFELMQRASSYFIGQHDFKNLSVSRDEDDEKFNNNTICNIYNLSLTESENEIIIMVEADRFLRKMVRCIVGMLIDIGRGRYSLQQLERIYTDGLENIYCAPAWGLCLMEVKY